jgi:predicted hotdog family 3-hydroxylacyl-ACP dehydratase
MLLIDEIVEADETYAVTTSIIKPSYPLTNSSGAKSLLMVELAAQTAGVCHGLDRIKEKGVDSSKMGWLVGIKRAKFHVESIPMRTTVVTRSENVHTYDKLREVSAVIHMDETVIGEITLQLYQL